MIIVEAGKEYTRIHFPILSTFMSGIKFSIKKKTEGKRRKGREREEEGGKGRKEGREIMLFPINI